jgi:hypothetical protein
VPGEGAVGQKHITCRHMTMAPLADQLQEQSPRDFDAVVVDRTDLSSCNKISIALWARRNGVVPFAVEVVGEQLDGGKFLLADLDPFRVLARVELVLNAKAGSGGGGGDQVDDDFVTHERFAAPVVRDEGEQKRCSILFHLLVPGGKWLTEISSLVSSASFCNSSFHNRTRDPLLPPPSAVIRS